jgi:iron complex outermembrane receptor protein
VTGAPICIGGAAFTTHSIAYNNWLPTLTARCLITDNWSAYGQFAMGGVIPPSAVFDVPGGNVLTPPKPTTAQTYQIGSSASYNRWTVDVDAYYVHFQNGYQSYLDERVNGAAKYATGPHYSNGGL